MRSRNNNYSSQTQIKVSPKSLKDGPLDESYHSNQLQNALRQVQSQNYKNENYEVPPRYRRFVGENKRYRNNNYQRGNWHEKKNSDFNQNQNQNQNQNHSNSDYHPCKDESQQKHAPNINEDTKATSTPTRNTNANGNDNDNDRERQRQRVSHSSPHSHKSHSSRSSYRDQGQHESETKWDNDTDQDEENRKRKNPNISGNNNNSYNRDRDSKRVGNYDRDVANNDYHELETWAHDDDRNDDDRSNQDNDHYPYYQHRNGRNRDHRDRGYERDYGRSSRSNYDDYHQRNKRRVVGDNNYHRYERRDRDRYSSYDTEKDRFKKDSSKVCKFYNPYFKTGCKNRRCPFAHLKQDEFLIYCKFIRQQSDIDRFSQRKFDHALAYIKQGIPNKAFYIFRHLVQDYEFDAHCNFWLGRCYALFENRTREDVDCAVFHYQKAISLKPNIASFHAKYADFMIEIGRHERKEIDCYEYKQAKIHLLKALELNPSARYHLQYAKLLDEIEGEFVEAKKYYKVALETYSTDSRIRLNYARLLHKMGNLRAAKQEFTNIFDILKNNRQRYRSLNSGWLWPHYHYARLLTEMQYYDAAKKEFELCIQIQEHHNNKFFSEIYYEFSKLLFTHFNDNDHAYYYINRAVSHAPQRQWYKKLLYTIQDAYYQRNNDNQSPKDTNNEQDNEQDNEFKDEEREYEHEHEHEAEPNQDEQREIPNTNTNTNTTSGFGFGGQYEMEQETSYGYNHRDGNEDEDDYGVPDEDQEQDEDDCAASIGQLSALSFGSYGNNNNREHAFAEFNQKETKAKTPTNAFVDDMNRDISDISNNKNDAENEASLNIPINPTPEIPEMETRFCATEFDRFISSDTLFGNELEKYCDKFEDEGINDIRWLLNEDAMNDDFLQTKIKMNQESIILWKKSVNIFRNQYNIYIQWLQRNNFKRRYFSKFQVYGILNLESFFYYIKNKEDVLYMIGDQNERDADIIWQSAQNEYAETKNQC